MTPADPVDPADPAVGTLSEAVVLGAIRARLGQSSALVGPGDDAAVIAAPDGRVVATTDTLVHGPDFRLAWSSAFDLGWKSAAVNLADIAAMGARPTALFVALALPDETRLSFVEGLAEGLRAACDAPRTGLRGRGWRPHGLGHLDDRRHRPRLARRAGSRAPLRRARGRRHRRGG